MPSTRPAALSTIDWRPAFTLRERQSILHTDRGVSLARPRASDDEIAQWRAELSLTEDADYTHWLARNEWDDDELRELLGFSRADPAGLAIPQPEWLSALIEAYDEDDAPSAESLFLGAGARGRVFLTLAEPLVRRAISRVQAAATRLAGGTATPFAPETVHALFVGSLATQLLTRMDRTLTLQLHVARTAGHLVGETPEARFASFGALLGDPAYVRDLFAEYPLLARQLSECVSQWSNFTAEFLEHLCVDWGDLRQQFADGGDPGPLVRVEGGTGDPHRDGRSVQILTFAAGLRLVYKPRKMEVDQRFNALLEWVNREGLRPALRVPIILSRADHGWSEFFETADCRSPEEVERFYARQGALLALLYALEATDFHMENLIASGEQPILVDLEALLHPRFANPQRASGPRSRAHEGMDHSVLRIGLLPLRGDSSPRGRFDASGLGGGGDQLTPMPVLGVEKPGTDEKRYVRQHVKVPPSKNRAQLDGAATDAYDHRHAVVRGFSDAYAIILRDRETLVSDEGLVASFADVEVRVVVRPTRVYMRVLQEAAHPSLLGDAADHERLLQRLGGAVVRRPALAQLIKDEIADLQSGNVPIFTARPGANMLYTSRGTRVADFTDRTSLENVKRRIAGFGDADLARQIWFIRASLTTLALATHEAPPVT
ncbi:MAG: type 2 lanthipeptide synthetase LanM, partial [bacterium]